MSSRSCLALHRLRWFFAFVALLVPACSPPNIEKVGGYVLVYELDAKRDLNFDVKAMTGMIRRRVHQSGSRGTKVRKLGDGKLEVSLPGVDAEELALIKKLIATPGVLKFRLLATNGIDDEAIAASRRKTNTQGQDMLHGRWVRVDPNQVDITDGVQRQTESGEVETLVVEGRFGLNGTHLASIRAGSDELGRPSVDVSLRPAGAAKMKTLTSANLPDKEFGTLRRLGIIFDGQLISAPIIQSVIESRFQITGNFTQDDVEFMVAVLRAGTLPTKLKPEPLSVRKVEPVE